MNILPFSGPYGRGGGRGGGRRQQQQSDDFDRGDEGVEYRAPDWEATSAEGNVEEGGASDDAVYDNGQSGDAPPQQQQRKQQRKGGGRSGKRRRRSRRRSSGSSSAIRTAGASISSGSTRTQTASISSDSSPIASTTMYSDWYAGWGGVWGAGAWGEKDSEGRTYAIKEGKGGWTYWQYSNGDIQIADGPQSVTQAYLKAFKSSTWAAITNEIGAVKKQAKRFATWSKAQKTGAISPVSRSEVAAAAVGEKKAKGLNALFAALGQGSAAEGKTLVARAASEHGPEVAVAAEEYLAERQTSPSLLIAKIAKLEGKYAQAKAQGDRAKAAKYLAKLQGLKARLASVQSGEAEIVDGAGLPSEPVTSSFPWTYVAIGGGALIVLAALAASQKKGG